MSYLRYLGLFAYSGQHTACLPYVASFSEFSIFDCPSVSSNVYLLSIF
jgi:hypothetical protein